MILTDKDKMVLTPTEAPKAVAPVPFQASVKQGKLTARVPAKSVIVLTIDE